MRPLRFLLLALCLLIPSRLPAKDPAPTSSAAAAQQLLKAADEITREVSALRGLAIKKPINRGVLSRDQIGEKLKERIAKEYSPDEVRAESLVLKRLGLLPAEANYEQLILSLLMEQVAGFYDPFSAKLYIADWVPMDFQRTALAHEIDHALQDQHFDLKRFATPLKDDGDRQLARAALVEGDGTALMLEFLAQQKRMPLDQLPELYLQLGKQALSAGQAPLFDKAPTFLKETLIFPYFGGLGLVAALRRQGPWSTVNEAFKNPPETTEQVLHPEKYLKREPAIKIVSSPLAAWKSLKEGKRDVLGELVCKVLLGGTVEAEDAERAAAGWGGDRLVSYERPGSALPAIAWMSAWDSEADAEEAAAALAKVFAKLTGKAATPYTDGSGNEWLLERKKNRIVALLGGPAGTSAAAAQQMWNDWKVIRPGKSPSP